MKRNRGLGGLLNALSRRQFMGGAAAVGVSIAGMPKFASAAEEKKLNFYNWDTYIGETTLDDFKAATGIEVKMDLFADTSELFAKLRAGNPGYDVVVPSGDWIPRMVAADMLMPLDHSKIPNMSNLFPRFLDASFDKGRKYSLPYMWGTIGIGYRKSKVKEVPDSWKYLFDSDVYANKIAVLSDCGTMISCALKYLGYSANSIDPAENEAAIALITKQKGIIKSFADDNGQDLLASGEVDLTMEYNGDIAQLMTEDPDIGFVLPKEGGLVWQDTLAIPKGAPHVENAHAFINYIYEPEVNQKITDYIQYATPDKAGYDLMPEEYRTNEAIFPPEAALDASESTDYLGEEATQMREELCTKMKAA